MKKIIVIVFSICLILVVAFISLSSLLSSEKKLYTDISTEKLSGKIENDDTFITYFYSKTCAACKKVKTVINDYIESENQIIYGIDIDAAEDKGLLIQDLQIQGTPTVIFFKGGEEIERLTTVFDIEEFSDKASTVN